MMSSKLLKFHKMQGAGNDFVVVDNRQEIYSLSDLIKLAPQLCNRRFGVGSDGLLALNPPQKPGMDFTMIYRNADGSDAGMCGNGARCLALFAFSKGFKRKQRFNVHDEAYEAEIRDEKHVAIQFPIEAAIEKVTVDDIPLYQTFTGTQHVVSIVSENEFKNEENLIQQGRAIRNHPCFKPVGTNVNFIHGIDSKTIRIKTYEKGVENLTMACGTGAIAASLVWYFLQTSSTNGRKTCTVEASGGTLEVQFNYETDQQIFTDIQLAGPAEFVFEGKIRL